MPKESKTPKEEKSQERIKKNGEVFTPLFLAQQMIDKIPQSFWNDPNKTILEPACGDGIFVELIIRKKIKSGSSLIQAISTTYALDIMNDNILATRLRIINRIHAVLLTSLSKNKISQPSFQSQLLSLSSIVTYNIRKVKDTLSMNFNSLVPWADRDFSFRLSHQEKTKAFLNSLNLPSVDPYILND